jgi:acetolactate synthase-1/2/3 large subunit
MPTMTGARFLAETLREYGVTHVFFVPAIIRRALVEMEDVGIKRIISHGEKSAAYMADAYARVTGKPGLCFAQSVGAANLAAGLQDAYLGVSPVIAITGHRPPMHRHRNSYQEIEHSKPFASVTKYSAEVEAVEQLPHLLRQAFREVTTGQTLPAHLDFSGISGDVITDGILDTDVIVEEPFTQRPAFRPAPEPERVREAARILSQAERPVIVAGGGVTASGAEAEVLRLAEMLNIPVATALNAKGCIPENHPLSVGVVGSYSRWSANRVVSEADLVLFIGSHTGSQVTLDWRIPAVGTPVIQIDLDASELGRSYPAAYGLQGDAKRTLEAMIDVLEPTGGNATWVSRAQEHVQNWRDEHEPVLTSDAVPIRPERLCQELTDFLPSDAVLLADTGHAGIWTGSMVDLNHPGQSYLRAAGSLGWGLPAALGAKCGVPDRPVVCWTGDGGMWYHIGELETAVRYGINAVIVVHNNGGLNQDRRGDEAAYEGREGGNPGELWRFTDTNFAQIAESMGALGIRVTDPNQINSALDQAVSANRPTVVDIVSDGEVAAVPPWGP